MSDEKSKIIKLSPRKKRRLVSGKKRNFDKCGHLVDGVPAIEVDEISATCLHCGDYLDALWVLNQYAREFDALDMEYEYLANLINSSRKELETLDHKIAQKKSYLSPPRQAQEKLF